MQIFGSIPEKKTNNLHNLINIQQNHEKQQHVKQLNRMLAAC
jgi:hypothetical protein